MKSFGDLWAGNTQALPLPAHLPVRGLALDSRQVQAGDLFFALQGQLKHGADYIRQAAFAGAVGALVEEGYEIEADFTTRPDFPVAFVPNLNRQVSALADKFFDSPAADLEITGVTGTNAKSTTCILSAQMSGYLGDKTGVSGTIGFGLPGQLHKTQLTTPDAIETQRILSRLKQMGCSHACIEVSSHGLEQGRVEALPFRHAVFTNFSHDHLDDYEDMEAYWQAKKRLFSWPDLATVIVNADDGKADDVCAVAGHAKVIRYGFDMQADVRLVDVSCHQTGFTGMLEIAWASEQAKIPVQINLLGRFNLLNVLAACSLAIASGHSAEAVASTLSMLSAAPGRMQLVMDSQPAVVVDYAHNPDALKAALSAMREHGYERLFCVFGCGGNRDRQKRALMGHIASIAADAIWLTNDNPRGETPDAILQDIHVGCDGDADIHIVPDRAQAIEAAVAATNAGDCVLIAGKGHECEQVLGQKIIPLNDFDIARSALQEKLH